MPSLDVKLSWAVPVEVDKLGAHLQAYIDTLPVLNTLRLCNRFGRGPKATITKLPIELVEKIQAFVNETQRKKLLKGWKKKLNCCERACEPADHFTLEEIRAEYYDGCHGWDCDCCPARRYGNGKSPSPSPKKLRRLFNAMDHDELWNVLSERCSNARESWSDRLSLFTEESAVLRAHFGLDVWTSTVRIGNDGHGYEEEETTVAYFTLPGAIRNRKSWELSRSEFESDYINCESGYGMPVDLDTTLPSPKSLARFQRALNILDLKVFEHPSQTGPVLASTPEKSSEDAAAATTKQWPKQTLLVKSIADLR